MTMRLICVSNTNLLQLVNSCLVNVRGSSEIFETIQTHFCVESERKYNIQIANDGKINSKRNSRNQTFFAIFSCNCSRDGLEICRFGFLLRLALFRCFRFRLVLRSHVILGFRLHQQLIKCCANLFQFCLNADIAWLLRLAVRVLFPDFLGRVGCHSCVCQACNRVQMLQF